MKNKKSLKTSLILAVLVLTAGVYSFRKDDAPPVARNDFSPVAQNSIKQSPIHLTQAAAIPVPAKPSHETSDALWTQFKNRFGPGLVAEFAPDGRISRVQGKLREGLAKSSGPFHPTDSRQVISRAREILEAARDLMQFDPALPLSDPQVNTSSVSAQIRFNETLDGIPLAPAGGVTVDLGPNGEILGIDSAYITGVRVSNRQSMSPDEARASIVASSDHEAPSRIIGGSKVIWTRPSLGNHGSSRQGQPGARVAYDFTVDGQEVIVDASSGEILFAHSRRQE